MLSPNGRPRSPRTQTRDQRSFREARKLGAAEYEGDGVEGIKGSVASGHRTLHLAVARTRWSDPYVLGAGPSLSTLWQMTEPTLLVIEDARDHALLVRVAARRALPGLDVRVAGDGREAIAYLAGTPPFRDRRSHPFPDLIILDLLMPDTDGFAVLEWAREHGSSLRCPIVVLTSSENDEHERRSLELGAAAFHKKPTALDGLGETVREIVATWIDLDSSGALQPVE